MNNKIFLRSGVWYGDRQIEIDMPSNWEVEVKTPSVPPPFSSGEIEGILDNPIGLATIAELCKGKSRPLILVDDLNRPTPASIIMPSLLKRITATGIPLENITILMATGTHGLPGQDALIKKAGSDATRCRLIIHDCFNDVVRIGKTNSGIPVFVNKVFLECDVVFGVGGIYPNHTAGFGGGSKLILGVLGIQTIYHLHFRNKSQGWGGQVVENPFRRELDEIAAMSGLGFFISTIIDGDRNIIKMYCGDQKKYFGEAVEYYRKTFQTAGADDADVIISNTYPNDLSLTFARMKGFIPLSHCKKGATRIAIAACDEGLGLHNIWPFVNVPKFYKWNHLWRVLSVKPLKEIISRIIPLIRNKLIPRIRKMIMREKIKRDSGFSESPIWLYLTGGTLVEFPANIPGIHLTSSWEDIVDIVKREHPGKEKLKVLVYSCAFLQLIEDHSFENRSVE